MPVISVPNGPTHALPGSRFTSLATPSRGSRDTAVWKVEVAPGTPGTPHWLTREEVFVVLTGRADVILDSTEGTALPGDAIVVPAGVRFELRNTGRDPLQLVCCMPVGGQARLEDGTMLTPPWAE